jgi:hypothetical protein
MEGVELLANMTRPITVDQVARESPPADISGKSSAAE